MDQFNSTEAMSVEVLSNQTSIRNPPNALKHS